MRATTGLTASSSNRPRRFSPYWCNRSGHDGGRPLATVRYHGFGLTAEAGFPTRLGEAAPVALGQRRWLLDQTLLAAARATRGVRVFEEASVEGTVVEGGRAIGLRVGGELRRGGLVVGADGLESRVRRSLWHL